MFKHLLHKIRSTGTGIIGSIAFYPAAIAISFLLLAVLIRSVQYTEAATAVSEALSLGLLTTLASGRNVLSILASGLISLTVFSFSMVMVVLNRASSALTPRVLPGIITQKNHQVVLGVYIGSIIFIISSLLTLNQQNVPLISITLSLIFGLLCFALFIYFIHSISQSIRIEMVMKGIRERTEINLRQLLNDQQEHGDPPNKNEGKWVNLCSPKNGYLKNMDESSICSLLANNGMQLHLLAVTGQYVIEGEAIGRIRCKNNEPVTKDLLEEIGNQLDFYEEEFARQHYRFGIRHLSEIAVKAMSPGINDPGTATKTIHLLTKLFLLVQQLPEHRVLYTDSNGELILDTKNSSSEIRRDKAEGDVRVWLQQPSFELLLRENFQPILTYAIEDVIVIRTLLQSLRLLKDRAVNDTQCSVLLKLQSQICHQARKYISDKEELNLLYPLCGSTSPPNPENVSRMWFQE